MRVAVVGAGPGGLYFSRLLKHRRPSARIDIFEQNPAGATFGFGVTLGGSSLGRLAQADPVLVRRLSEAMVFNADQAIVLNDEAVPVAYAKPGGSIARLKLLQILQQACAEVGLTIRHDRQVQARRDLQGYDLIVASDGVNSALRNERSQTFGTRCRTLTNHFAWFGVGKALSPNALVFREAHGGRFIAHYYTYDTAMSTFVAECDAETWTRAGLERMSDLQRRQVFEEVFAPELQGAELIENRSIWRQFPAITNARWFDGETVLIGDALRSAHFSIGSGTRLAMEDAQELVEALCEQSVVADALALFVQRRRPVRDRFGEAAERSFDWYEQVKVAMRQPPLNFTHDFLTRTGRVDEERLHSYAPAFAERYRASVAELSRAL